MPFFGQLNFPPTANIINEHLINVATFDLINTAKWVDPYLYGEVPEKYPYMMSFEMTGYESTLLITNISVILWIYILHGVIFVFFFPPIWLISRSFGKCTRRKQKLKGYFFWGGPLRTLTETFLELLLASVLNMHTAEWGTDSPSEKFSNYASVTILGTLGLLTLFCLLFFCYNYDSFKYQGFREAYGALIEGHATETVNLEEMR